MAIKSKYSQLKMQSDWTRLNFVKIRSEQLLLQENEHEMEIKLNRNKLEENIIENCSKSYQPICINSIVAEMII